MRRLSDRRTRAQLRGAVAAAGLLVGRRSSTSGGIVLGYHDVTAEGAERTSYDVSATTLRAHLRLLRGWGLRIVPLDELVDRLVRGSSVDCLVAVTFDDSLQGVHHHGLPVLAELDVPATVFAVAGVLGRSPAWWPEAGRVMSQRELHETAAAGVQVASHTMGHPSLPAIDQRALRHEIVDSKHTLQDLTGTGVDLLAYPYGHHDPAARDVAAAAGYRAGFSFLNGRVVAGADMFKLPRFTMTSAHHRLRLAYHVARAAESWPDSDMDVVVGPEQVTD